VRLHSIETIIEAENEQDAASVLDAIARATCPHPDEGDEHSCPRGWMMMTHELDDDEAAIWCEPDTLNR